MAPVFPIHARHYINMQQQSKIEPTRTHMAIEMTVIRSLLLLALVLATVAPQGADGAGRCGSTPVGQMALKLAPCAPAVEDPAAAPSGACCAAVQDIFRRQSPECLCALLLSDPVRHAGVRPEVAITIPKRCNLASRPAGYKCGDYTMPSLQE
ncbi:hypothetical protein ACP4OV_011344 [Aristida adscensionis]